MIVKLANLFTFFQEFANRCLNIIFILLSKILIYSNIFIELVSPDPKEQKDLLKAIWFNMYSRGQGKIGSSGFEHIFLSELKNGEISGKNLLKL